MTLHVYLDESFTEAPYLVAGWIASAQEWESVTLNWNIALASERPITYFKLHECLAFEGQFKGWSQIERDAKVKSLIRMVPSGFRGIAVFADQKIFRRTFQMKLRPKYRDPFFICTLGLMHVSVNTFDADRIDFFLDRSKTTERYQRWYFRNIKQTNARYGGCETLDDKTTSALQCADLSSGYIRQTYETERQSIAALSELGDKSHVVYEMSESFLSKLSSKYVLRDTGTGTEILPRG